MNTPTTIADMKSPAPREASLPSIKVGFFDVQSFELLQRTSNAFCRSDLVPKSYQGNLPNTMIAMDMAQRIGANPLMVMQNLYIVHGTPGWSSKFLIATINACGRYSSLRYEWKGEPGQDDYGCRAWAVERETGERLNGIWVTWKMVKAEGWDAKNGSKWKTMPDQMFVYRAAAFWQRAYAPELGMGLQTTEDLEDAFDAKRGADGAYSVDLSALKQEGEAASGPSNVDLGTGEIIDVEIPQADGQEATGQGSADAPGFDDAIAAVQSGDLDMARDIARGLPEGQQQAIETAIANKQGGQQAGQQAGQPQRQRRERSQGGLNVE